MANLMLFLSGLVSYLVKYVAYIVAVVIAVFIGIGVRKNINSKTIWSSKGGKEE